jgi:RNA polymerase sigma-70 factor (TIGR02943 family)
MTVALPKLNPNNWITDYSDELYGYAMSKTSKPDLAEDLVQETFLAALKSLGNFKGLSSERTWLFTILKFKIADYYRKASTRYEISNASLGNDDHSSYIDNYFEDDGNWKGKSVPKDWAVDYSSSLENKELAIALNSCIEKLPNAQKRLVLLKLVEEQETELVCKELNITPTNYWVIIHRAKLQLRTCLEMNWIKI